MRPRILALTLAALALLPAGQASAGERRELDRVVAVIEGQVLTLSELELEARVALLLRGGSEAATARLDEATLAATLDYAIGQRLHAAEAEKLQVFTLEEGEVDRALEQLEQRLGGRPELNAFLGRHEADRQMLGAILARGLRAERILDSKIRLKAQVPEAEVRRHYDAHALELGAPYESVRAGLKEQLMRERYQQLARAELVQVRKSASVRIIAPLGQGKTK